METSKKQHTLIKQIPKKYPRLLEYQLKPIKYLVSQCKCQHGLLINHTMGSGKTLVGTYFAKNYPDSKLIIILPNGLQEQWLSTARQIKQKITKFITFEELRKYSNEIYNYLKKNNENNILVIDEAHNLIPILEELSNSTGEEEEENKEKKKKMKKVDEAKKNQLYMYLEIFKGFKKVLLMSGTPIIRTMTDIRWMINIAAGKRIVPYNEHEFVKEYYKFELPKVIVNGWLNKILALNIMGLRIFPEYMQVNLNWLDDSYYAPKIRKTMEEFFQKITKFKDINLLDKSNLLWKKMEAEDQKAFKEALIATTVITICMSMFYLFYNMLKTNYNRKYNFRTLDLKKIKVAGKYISYYDIKEGDKNYPKTKVVIKRVPYTDYQLELFTRLIYNVNISDTEAVLLGINKSITEAELFKPSFIYNNTYLRKGRIIGNLNEIDNLKIKDHTLSIPYRDQTPIKFREIVRMYREEHKQTLIYSNFYESGILLLSDYLHRKKIKHNILTPDTPPKEMKKAKQDFQDGKVKIILLHPSFYEGFSINGVRVFHILEPMEKFYQKEQLLSRAIRYSSHAHLKESERNVKIYQWQCSLKSLFEQVLRIKESLKDWFNNDLTVEYFSRYTDFSTSLSPDDQVQEITDNSENEVKEFADKMKSISVDSKVKKHSGCCVFSEICKVRPSCISVEST